MYPVSTLENNHQNAPSVCYSLETHSLLPLPATSHHPAVFSQGSVGSGTLGLWPESPSVAKAPFLLGAFFLASVLPALTFPPGPASPHSSLAASPYSLVQHLPTPPHPSSSTSVPVTVSGVAPPHSVP